ncbi:MAG: hypothetical protein PXY39_05895 [archaeon]|nr:hypothetical protein [archaeon]
MLISENTTIKELPLSIKLWLLDALRNDYKDAQQGAIQGSSKEQDKARQRVNFFETVKGCEDVQQYFDKQFNRVR